MKKMKNNIAQSKKPWPTKEVMVQVYEKQLWGTIGTEFYSGEGSYKTIIVEPYIEEVIKFLKSFKKPLTVCDLGCGDFNVGKQFVKFAKKYIAVDIVPNLILYNKKHFNSENLEFHCVDIAKDELPKGDCVILRQVLQHLSNKEVKRILNKIVNFNYLILTEHIPEGHFIPNKDIISGQGIRLKKQSGIDLLAEPFNFKIKTAKQIHSVNLENNKGIILTTLYTL